MKIDVPLEIGDVVWIINDREPFKRVIAGVAQQRNNNGEIVNEYILERYSHRNINSEYFLSKKDAEIEIARRILEGLKDEN